MKNSPKTFCLLTNEFPGVRGAHRSGISTYAELVAGALIANGWEVTVVHFLDPGTPAVPVVPPTLPIIWHPVVFRRTGVVGRLFPGLVEGVQLALAVRSLDAAAHFDAIEGMNIEGICWATAIRFGRRFRLRMHTSLRQHIDAKKVSWNWTRRFGVWLDGFAARRSHRLVTHTRSHAEELRAEYHLGSRPIDILPHATREAAQTPFQREPAWVGYIGGLERRKGADLFLGAIPAIAKAMPGVSFVLIGPDHSGAITQEAMRLRADMPDLRDRIVVTGAIADAELEVWWQRLAVLVVPSRYESFGLAMIEAFSRGVPVLSSDAAALLEVGGDACMSVPAAEDALAAGAVRLLRDPDERQRLAVLGHRRFQTHFSEQAFREGLGRIYP